MCTARMGEQTKEENDAVISRYFAFNEFLREKGKQFAGEALQPTPMATTVNPIHLQQGGTGLIPTACIGQHSTDQLNLGRRLLDPMHGIAGAWGCCSPEQPPQQKQQRDPQRQTENKT